MSRLGTWGRWGALTALSVTTAYTSRWLRDSVDARTRVRVATRPAAADPAGARAEQRLADTPLWRLVEGRLARRALRPFRVRPTLRPLRALVVEHGPGGLAISLAGAAPQDAVVVATAARAGMGELARERAGRRGHRAGLAFVRAAADRLPFRDDVFDLGVSAGALHEWRDPEGALRELGRTLMAGDPGGGHPGGGQYLVADLRRDVRLPVWLLLRLGQSLFAPRALRALDEPSASYRAAYAPPEAEWLAARARLPDLNVESGAAWIMIERRAALPSDKTNTLAKENRR